MDTKLAVVTGGAHRLGRIFVETLAEQGYAVLVHYHRSGQQADDLVAQLRQQGVSAWSQAADLRQPQGIEQLFQRVDDLEIPLAVLVNSAAEMQACDVHQLTAADWDATLALNLRAPFLCAQRAAARMDDGGLIVNLSDVGARQLWTMYPAYVVSKAALETLTRLLARALAPRVRVNAIAPGLVLPGEDLPAERWDQLVAKTPWKRPVPVDEIAAALDYLLAATTVTGQVLTVAAGYDLR